jgi:ribose transport system substrate-binding protein
LNPTNGSSWRRATWLVAVLLAAAACGGGSNTGGGTSTTVTGVAAGIPTGSSVKFAHSFCYLNNQGMQIYKNSPEAAARKLGWTVLPAVASGPAPGSISQQLTDINTLLAEGATVLAINPCDSQSIIPAVVKANAQHVPVILTDTGTQGGIAINVAANETQSGALACQGLIDGLKAQHSGQLSGTVIQIQGDIAGSAGQDRTKGFEDCIKSNAPALKIITDPTKWDPQSATAELRISLSATPSTVGIYMQSDTQFWTGTKQVMDSLGLLHKRGETGHVVVVGVDGGGGTLQGITDGYVDADVSQPKTGYFNIGLFFLKQAKDGTLAKVNPGDYTQYKMDVSYKASGGGLWVLAPSTLVTTANATSSSFWGNAKCDTDATTCATPLDSLQSAVTG